MRSPLERFVALGLAGLVTCTALRSQDEQCLFNDDCRAPLVCAARRCRTACRDGRDCPGDAVCRVGEEGGRVCVAPSETWRCARPSECGEAETCSVGRCVGLCPTDRDAECVVAPDVPAGDVPGGDVADADAGRFDGAVVDQPVADVHLGDVIEGEVAVDVPAVDTDDRGTSLVTDAMDVSTGDLPATRDAGILPPWTGPRFIQVCALGRGSCALTSAGAVWCWGQNLDGALGNRDSSMEDILPPGPVPDVDGATALSCSGRRANGHVCVLRSDRTVRCWGRGDELQIDASRGVHRPTMPPLPLGAESIAVMVAGDLSSYAITDRGRLVSWGSDLEGQLGLGRTGAYQPPGFVTTIENMRLIAAGQDHTCAVSFGNEVFCAGSDDERQFGDGTTRTYASREHYFVRVSVTDSTSPTVVSLVAGLASNCLLDTLHRVYCWGLVPHLDERLSRPAPLSNGEGVYQVAVSEIGICAVRLDGRVHCWGPLAHLDSKLSGPDPDGAEIAGLPDAIGVAIGTSHACAIRNDGSVWCWGDNSLGQLGTGDLDPRLVPTRIALP